MRKTNNKGFVAVEVLVVMLFIGLFGHAANKKLAEKDKQIQKLEHRVDQCNKLEDYLRKKEQ